MVNKRISTPDDPLVQTIVYLKISQKKALESASTTTGRSVSALFRDWVDSQAGTRERDLTKLKCERDEFLSLAQRKDSEIRKLEAENSQIDSLTTLRNNLLSKQVSQLTELLIDNGGFLREIEGAIKVRVDGINKKLNGSGVEHVTVEEVRNAVKEAAWNKGVGLHE